MVIGMSIFNIFVLLGGLAMFLYGMDVMGKSLEQTAGGRLQVILSRMTSSPLRGLLLGLAVTAVIQSSSATTVMVVGFVNSGLMDLYQTVGVIMGANIGTTVTAWLLSLTGLQGDSFVIQMLSPNAWAPLLGFAGIALFMFGKEKQKNVGQIFLGFAILMTGMNLMSEATAPLADAPWFADLFLAFTNPVLGVLVGAVLTGIIQSSSASVGILQALSISTGAVSMAAAMPIIMGQNIGTTVTALIASAGANKNARRTAFIHLYFNIIGTVVFLTGFYALNAVFDFPFYHDQANAFNIAVVHTVFNLVTTLILLPFSKQLVKLAILTVPDAKEPEQTTLLDQRLLSTPAVAVNRAMLVGGDMAEVCRTALLQAMSTTRKWDDAIADEVRRKEDAVDHYEDVLGTYLVQLSGRPLSTEDNRTINTLLHTINDFERISDHSVNLLEAAEEIRDKNIRFSDAALGDLGVLESAVQDIVNRTVDAFQNHDCYAAGKIEPMEEVIDSLVREVKTRHIARLQAGICTIEYGFVLDDLLTAYERIADHCSNIAVAMIEVAEDKFDTHEYLNNVKSGSLKFEQRYEKYRGRYTFPEEPVAQPAAAPAAPQ